MKTIACAYLLLLGAIPGFSQTAAKFDYYVLSLSWSPEYCQGHPSDQQCTADKHFGFVVHGLWPEYSSGGSPQNCSSAPGLRDPSTMLDIMPSLSLIQHEWRTHGTCSGLSADAYFALVRKAFASIQKVTSFAASESPQQVKKDFEKVNPQLQDNELMISCAGNYLYEVEICLSKTLQPMACTAPRDCRARSIRIPPVQ